MPTSVNFAGSSYNIPSAGELNWSSLSSFLISVANNAGLKTTQVQAIRVATTSPVTVAAATDWAIETKLTVPGAVAVNLPAGVSGQTFVVVDGTGDAATNNVTITGNGGQTIAGSATFVLNSNRGAVLLAFDGTEWQILARPSANAPSAGGIVYSNGSALISAAGTSGGIPYFSSSNVPSSSAALTANHIVAGGGAGGAPTTDTATALDHTVTSTGNIRIGILNNSTATDSSAMLQARSNQGNCGVYIQATNSATPAVQLASTKAHEVQIVYNADAANTTIAKFGSAIVTLGASAGTATHVVNGGINLNTTAAAAPTNGMYRSAANDLSFSTNGTLAATINSSQVTNFVSGISIAGSSTLTTFTQATTATTFTGDGTGAGTSASVNLRVQRVGDWVTIFVPAFTITTGTATGAINANTAIGSFAIPSTTSSRCLCVPITDNATNQNTVGLLTVNTSGILTIQTANNPGNFANAATSGVARNFSATYYVGTGS